MRTNEDIYTDEDMYMDDSEVDATIIRRGRDEYIILNGRILTTYGAPVRGNESAPYYLHENIIRPVEEGRMPADLDTHFNGELWPEKAGVFTPDDLVDLHRALKRKRVSAR